MASSPGAHLPPLGPAGLFRYRQLAFYPADLAQAPGIALISCPQGKPGAVPCRSTWHARLTYHRPMAQRGDPARIQEAQRLGVRKRLIAQGLSEAAVDRWMEAWEASGPLEAPGGSFWGRGADWILRETAAGRKPVG